ncbi:DUF397 domain-containing protein [Streptomyces sp. NPDC090442]|uniref:DUF397 domain-containing protein n=1 Tax=Streptomyces sp. NPDC090442 TaxID=3365962 RepID=UPI00380667F0
MWDGSSDSPASAATADVVPVRDSKAPEGPVLVFSPSSFSSFILAVKADAFTG